MEKNEFIRLLEGRHAKRAFLRDRTVPRELVDLVLSSAALGTPSTQNTQPWGVTVVQGKDIDDLRTLLLAKFDRDETDTPEYQVRAQCSPQSDGIGVLLVLVLLPQI